MEWFDAYDEVYAAVEQFVAQHGTAPAEVAVSGVLYGWLAEMQRESALLSGIPAAEPMVLESAYGSIPIRIDEMLGPFEILLS